MTSSLRSSSGFAPAPCSVSRIVTGRLGSPATSPNPFFSPVRSSSARQLSPEQVSLVARVDGLNSTPTCLQAPSQHTSILAALASAASGAAICKLTPTGVPIAVHAASGEQPAASRSVSRVSRRTFPQTKVRRAGFTTTGSGHVRVVEKRGKPLLAGRSEKHGAGELSRRTQSFAHLPHRLREELELVDDHARAKFKRLVGRGILLETEPGLFIRPHPWPRPRARNQPALPNPNNERVISISEGSFLGGPGRAPADGFVGTFAVVDAVAPKQG
ncbi:hypothetical protein ACIHFD_61915 [Nonomuraea sp. NPDC051941]|uniref:hypothetical protein n=1 Tax=Nonomuraea sp. NPDC051941 TaxID=3364373 RepID=UPI0037C89640